MPESVLQDVDPLTPSPERRGRRSELSCHEAVEVERDRVGRELNDVVVRRLFALGLSLESAVGRHPELEGELRSLVRETDELIRATRAIALGAGSSRREPAAQPGPTTP